jgi:hypothetical protein
LCARVHYTRTLHSTLHTTHTHTHTHTHTYCVCVVWLCISTLNHSHYTCPRERSPGARPAGAPRKAEVPARHQGLVLWFRVYVLRGRRQARNASGKRGSGSQRRERERERRKTPSRSARARAHTHAQIHKLALRHRQGRTSKAPRSSA